MKKRILLLSAFILAVPPVFSEDAATEAWRKDIEKKIDLLTRELEKSRLGEVAEPVYESKYGFAPAAAKVYHARRGVSIGGYGEMVLQDFSATNESGSASGKKREMDFLRAIVYVGHKYTDRILFNSEIEFEHASTAGGANPRGEISLEFAYLDFMLCDSLGARAGLLLVPIGLTNEFHEPTVFHGSRRPSVETNILPTTWRENGAGLFGKIGPLQWRTYVIAGLQAVKDSTPGVSGFSASSLFRNGRSKGAKSQAEDLAWVGRADMEPVSGITIGASAYSGRSGQNNLNAANKKINGLVNIQEGHANFNWHGWEARALYAAGSVGSVADINAKNSLTGNASVGERFHGGYAEAAFDMLSLTGSKHYLAPFVRYESYDTQQRVPAGFSRNPANQREEITFGLTYKPHPNTVLKADWQNISNKAKTGVDQFNLAMGYLF